MADISAFSIQEFLSQLLPALEHLRGLGYWIALAAALFETTVGIGLLLPGSTIVLLLGLAASQGVMDIGDLIWFAAIGAILGDNINYYLGKRYGERWYRNGVWFLSHGHFVRARALFDKHGGKSVFLGRFVPGIKELVPLVAGIVRMSRSRFLFWNILGGFGWSLEFLLTGYLVGQSLQVAKLWVSRIGYFVLLLLLTVVLLSFFWQWLSKQGQEVFGFLSDSWKHNADRLRQNPKARHFLENHPEFFRFLERRLNQSSFRGLPLTLLTLVFLVLAVLFGIIVGDILTADPIVAADYRTANLLAASRTPEITRFFLFVTALGRLRVMTVFTVAAVAVLWLFRKRFYILPLLCSLLLSHAFTSVAKVILQRPRPDVAVYLESSFSFPSGHATIAISFYGFLTYILVRQTRSWTARANIIVAGVFLAALIGFSRMVLGVHYLSDVLGGYLVGGLWLTAGIGATECFLHMRKDMDEAPPTRADRGVAGGVLASALAFFLCTACFSQPPLLVHPARGETVIQNPGDIFFNPDLRFSQTIGGERDLPIGFVVEARDDADLFRAFSRAGWLFAGRADFSNLIKMEKALIRDEPAPQAPVSPAFWGSRVNDFGFEKPTPENTARKRYRARVWKSPYMSESRNPYYAGTVCLDNGVKWLFTHKMSPDIDAARNELVEDLKAAGVLARVEKKPLVGRFTGETFTGDPFMTRGDVFFLSLSH